MFYKMIETKRNEWLASETCTVKAVIDYIVKTGQMRDAQVEAIKTYLFLKIACGCKPLAELFCEGAFNTLDLNDLEVSHSTRKYLKENKAAAALFEYACLTNDAGEQVSPRLEQQIRKEPESIDCHAFFHKAFYDLSYTDYLFSLPMGAGKTYLMAAFIYLDLYFARNEPKNSAFAHNFIIVAPSGLKSSVVPSLKTIQNFDPTWVIPEPAASELKRMISFEVLDQSKTAKKSNKTKNPNVQKIANHQPLSELFGLVAVTNAEKVILDRIQESQGQINLFEESDDEKDRHEHAVDARHAFLAVLHFRAGIVAHIGAAHAEGEQAQVGDKAVHQRIQAVFALPQQPQHHRRIGERNQGGEDRLPVTEQHARFLLVHSGWFLSG